MKNCGMRDSREKGAGMRDQTAPPPFPLPDPVNCFVLKTKLKMLISVRVLWQSAAAFSLQLLRDV